MLPVTSGDRVLEVSEVVCHADVQMAACTLCRSHWALWHYSLVFIIALHVELLQDDLRQTRDVAIHSLEAQGVNVGACNY